MRAEVGLPRKATATVECRCTEARTARIRLRSAWRHEVPIAAGKARALSARGPATDTENAPEKTACSSGARPTEGPTNQLEKLEGESSRESMQCAVTETRMYVPRAQEGKLAAQEYCDPGLIASASDVHSTPEGPPCDMLVDLERRTSQCRNTQLPPTPADQDTWNHCASRGTAPPRNICSHHGKRLGHLRKVGVMGRQSCSLLSTFAEIDRMQMSTHFGGCARTWRAGTRRRNQATCAAMAELPKRSPTTCVASVVRPAWSACSKRRIALGPTMHEPSC